MAYMFRCFCTRNHSCYCVGADLVPCLSVGLSGFGLRVGKCSTHIFTRGGYYWHGDASVDPQRIRGVLAGDVITRPHKKTSDTRGSWNDSLGYMNVMLSVRRFALRNLYSAFTSVIRPVDARGDDVVRLTHHRRSRILGARLPKENRAGRRSGNLRQNTSRRLPSDRRTRHRPRRCRKRPFGNSLALDGAFQVLPFVRPVLFFGLYTYLSHPPDRRNGVAVLLPASCEYGTTFE